MRSWVNWLSMGITVVREVILSHLSEKEARKNRLSLKISNTLLYEYNF